MSVEVHRRSLVGAILGALVCALGALAIAGRHLDLPILFQFRPTWLPAQYNPALCMVALGLGLIALGFRRFRIATVFGVLPAAIGAVTLATWLFDLHPGIDQVFFRHGLPEASFAPGRMSPMAALAYALIGIAVCLGASARRVPAFAVAAWVIGVLTCVGGLLSTLMSAVHGNRLVIESLRFVYSSPHSSLAVALAGGAIAVLTASQKHAARPVDRTWQLPVAAGIAALMVSTALWQEFAAEEVQWVQTDTGSHGQQIVAQIESDGRARASFFAFMASQAGKYALEKDEELWVTDITELMRGVGWLRQVSWFNQDGSVRHRAGFGQAAGPIAETILPISDPHGTQIGTLVLRPICRCCWRN